MTRKEELEVQITALRHELIDITAAETALENRAFAGRCFKTLNNDFYDPETPRERWWVYVRVVDTTEGIRTLDVQRDKDGRITIDPNEYRMPMTLNSYEEITRGEWNAAYAEILAEAGRL